MLTFLDRLLPWVGRLARRSDLAAPVFVPILLGALNHGEVTLEVRVVTLGTVS